MAVSRVCTLRGHPEGSGIGPIRAGVTTARSFRDWSHQSRCHHCSHHSPIFSQVPPGYCASCPPPKCAANSKYSSVSVSFSYTSGQSIKALLTKTLTTIRENFKSLQAKLDKPKEIMCMSEPLFQLPDHEEWPAALVLNMKGMQEIAAILHPPTTSSSATAPVASGNQSQPTVPRLDKGNTNLSLNSFIRQNMWIILLRDDIELYGRQAGRKNYAAHTPFGLKKAIVKIETMLTKTLNAKKRLMATTIKDYMVTTKPLSKISKLIANIFSEISEESGEGSIAYLRLVINLNQHKQLTDPKGTTFWNQIDDDLQIRMKQCCI
ncbi:uncharacterized protein VP01_2502g3 [Puccinia sorghi]|uniref:Uncharacterized protein n=1 Tax=Puccinia sorghi TaxID=27349 RepID=A0A0L6V5N2_9BASI|nr:uncharacterized protein VP01_2502g3 [Puccinia sorghi]